MNFDPSFFNGKAVLVTGGLGFVGSNVVNSLVVSGAKVSIYDCLDPRSGGNMANVEDVRGDVEIIINDIRNLEGLSSAMIDKELVVNCAAYTSHPNSMKEPYVDIDVNCKGVINLLEAVRRFSPESKIVHVGTSTQVGPMRLSQIDEMHPEFPIDIYSANKSVGEKYIMVYGHVYGLKTSVVRLANNYGPRSNIDNPDFGFMNYFVGLGLQGKEITVYGDGSQLRNITYIDDSVSAILKALADPNSTGEVVFAVSDFQYAIREVAEGIASNIGGQVRYVEWPKGRERIDVGDAVISSQKIDKLLGWKAKTDLSSGLQKTKKYFSKRLDRYLKGKKW